LITSATLFVEDKNFLAINFGAYLLINQLLDRRN